jgi:eukaryotic-like serine/threonine-protein kinase
LLALGIDFGTATTRVAVWREGAASIIPFAGGAPCMPSVVAIAADGVRTGQAALRQAPRHPGQTVRGARRLLGRRVDDPVVEVLARRVAFKMESAASGQMLLRLEAQRFELVEVLATLLGEVMDHVAHVCKERPSAVVLGAPAWFGRVQFEALAEVAKRAELATGEIHPEALCSAWALPQSPGDRLIGIVDLGAAGVSASIVAVGPAGAKVLAAAGDPFGGGEDFDWVLAGYVFQVLKARVGAFTPDASVIETLRQVCEVAKKGLGASPCVSAIVPFLPVGEGLTNETVELNRDTVERLLQDSIQRVQNACKSVIAQSGLDVARLSAVYVTGGGAGLAPLCGAIASVFGSLTQPHPQIETSVAAGAARLAAAALGLVPRTQRSLAPQPVPESRRPVAPVSLRAMPAVAVPSGPPSSAPGFAKSAAPASSPVVPISVRPAAPASARPVAPEPAPAIIVEPDEAVGALPVRERVNAVAFRNELSGLLSGLQAGKAVASRAPKPRRQEARSNEILEEPEELAERTIEYNVERLQAIWAQLAVVMQTARQYRWDHPQTEHQLERAMADLTSGLADAGRSIQWEVRALEFTYRGHAIWQPDRAPYDRIPYELFAEGVRRLQVLPGLTPQELRDLLGVLMRDTAMGFGADDDATTALWDRKFTHVAWYAVDAFAEGDDPVFEEQRDAIAGQLQQLGAVSKDGESGLEAHAAQRRASAESAARIDAGLRTELVDVLDPEPAEWIARYAGGVASTFASKHLVGVEGTRLKPLADWTERQVGAHAPDAALRLFCALDKAASAISEADARKLRDELVSSMFPPVRMDLLLHELEDERHVDDEMLHGVKRVLDLFPGDGLFDPVVAHWATLPPRIQALAFEFMGKRAQGHEKAVGEILASCAAEHAKALITALRAIDSATAKMALAGALRSPHLEIRVEGISALPDAPAEQVREQLQRLIEDPDVDMRVQVLQLIIDRHLVPAGPLLMRRIHSDAFGALRAPEQRMLFQAVGSLNQRRADELAINLLDKKQLLEAGASEQTRALAAEFLGSSESREALEALQRNAKRKLLGSNVVADAASAAIEVWTRRHEEADRRPQ